MVCVDSYRKGFFSSIALAFLVTDVSMHKTSAYGICPNCHVHNAEENEERIAGQSSRIERLEAEADTAAAEAKAASEAAAVQLAEAQSAAASAAEAAAGELAASVADSDSRVAALEVNNTTHTSVKSW